MTQLVQNNIPSAPQKKFSFIDASINYMLVISWNDKLMGYIYLLINVWELYYAGWI
jgi:hypothetical protein